MMTTLESNLLKLWATRQAAEHLAAQIAEIEAPVKEKTDPLRAGKRALEAQADALSDACSVAYGAAVTERRGALIRGASEPLPDLPPGCSVRELRGVEVVAPEALPREFLAPDLKAIKAAKSAVPGTRETVKFSFAFSSKGAK